MQRYLQVLLGPVTAPRAGSGGWGCQDLPWLSEKRDASWGVSEAPSVHWAGGAQRRLLLRSRSSPPAARTQLNAKGTKQSLLSTPRHVHCPASNISFLLVSNRTLTGFDKFQAGLSAVIKKTHSLSTSKVPELCVFRRFIAQQDRPAGRAISLMQQLNSDVVGNMPEVPE